MEFIIKYPGVGFIHSIRLRQWHMAYQVMRTVNSAVNSCSKWSSWQFCNWASHNLFKWNVIMCHDQVSRHLCAFRAQKSLEGTRVHPCAHGMSRDRGSGQTKPIPGTGQREIFIFLPVAPEPPAPCLLYTACICHSGFVNFLKFHVNTPIPGASLPLSHILLFNFTSNLKVPENQEF